MSKTIGRTFIFEADLWAKLDDDAKRCLRSSTKQMEAILKTYFSVANVELSEPGLQMLGELMPRSNTSLPMITATVEATKKKRTA